jgi:predicted permease
MFAGAPTVLGESLILDGRPFTVVGVLPRNFHVPYETDVWFPSHFDPDQRSIFLLARLADGVSHGQVRLALEPVALELNRLYPNVLRGLGITVVEARDYFVSDGDQVALVLMAAVAVLLLIGCTNVALLLTTRFASRQVEVAMRAALGCSRSRQVRQFVTEGILLFVAGGLIGLALAVVLKDGLVVLLPEAIAEQVGFTGIPLDWRLVGFSALLSVTAGVGFGLLAAMRTSRGDLQAVMKGGSRSVAGTSSQGLLGSLVVVEVALAVVLLFSAGVMVEAFQRLSRQDRGFQTDDVATMRLDLTSPRYATADAKRVFVEQVLERVRARPGVIHAAATTVNPVCCGNWSMRVVADGTPSVSQDDVPSVQHFIVTPGYFETLQWPLVEGRAFTADDGDGREPVVMIERATADRFWPGASAIGKRLQRWSSDGQYPWMTVVGVVETGLEEGAYPESWYLPHAQHADGPSATGVHLLVRTTPGQSVNREIRAVIADLDPGLAVYGVDTLNGQMAENLKQDRLGAWASTTFAAGGLLLASLGLYGVLSFVVAGDRVEIAVRRALGASSHDVIRLILMRGLRLVGVGVIVGGVAAWGVGGVLPHLFESAAPDYGLIAWAAGALVVAALVAMAAPVRRALRLNPLEAMRT